MGYEGADVDKLRAAAAHFDELAATLESSATSVHALVSQQWWGADADRFRAQWAGVSKPSITAGAAMLRDGADALRRNAAEQEQVSSRSGGAGPVAASTYQTQPAPKGAAGLFSALHATDKSYDGMQIQQVVGPDGKTRFIVYLNGTDQATRLTEGRNLPVVNGLVDTYQLDRIDAALKAAGYQPGPDGTFNNGPDVMLVGYSQGGMDAQNIAADGRYHVTDMVTYGSPLTYADDPAINTVHLRADGDNVPDLPGELNALSHGDVSQAALIRAGVIDGAGDKVPYDQQSGPSQHIHQYDSGVAAPNPVQNGINLPNAGTDVLIGNHGVPYTYETVGADYDKDPNPALNSAQDSLARFQGDVVTTWGAATGAPPGSDDGRWIDPKSSDRNGGW